MLTGHFILTRERCRGGFFTQSIQRKTNSRIYAHSSSAFYPAILRWPDPDPGKTLDTDPG